MAQSLLIPRFQAQGPLVRSSGRQSLANVHLNFQATSQAWLIKENNHEFEPQFGHQQHLKRTPVR